MPISSFSLAVNKTNNPGDFTDTFAHKYDGSPNT